MDDTFPSDVNSTQIWRCICNFEQVDEIAKASQCFVQCEKCKTCQHLLCIDFGRKAGQPPGGFQPGGPQYQCERCAPDLHAETIQALTDGRKIWRERARRFKLEASRGAIREAAGAEECLPFWIGRLRARKWGPKVLRQITEADIALNAQKATRVLTDVLNDDERVELHDALQVSKDARQPSKMVAKIVSVTRAKWKNIPKEEREFMRTAMGI